MDILVIQIFNLSMELNCKTKLEVLTQGQYLGTETEKEQGKKLIRFGQLNYLKFLLKPGGLFLVVSPGGFGRFLNGLGHLGFKLDLAF